MSEAANTPAAMTVEAELRTSAAIVQIARFQLPDAVDSLQPAEAVSWLDLSLTGRPPNARAGFPQQWGPHRFEPLGRLFHVPPGHALHIRSDAGRQVSLRCRLEAQASSAWDADEIDWTDRRLEASLDVSNPHIRTLLLRLAEEAHRPGFASEVLTEMVIGQLAIELARFCEQVEDGLAAGGLAGWRLRVIDERLRDAPALPTLAELASLCNLSVRQLTRGFRASRGCSVNAYVSRSRIEGAKRLLAGEDSVKAIAFAMGFASPSSFAFAFRRATGVTPRQFRARLVRVNG